jgi:hypothetical protein
LLPFSVRKATVDFVKELKKNRLKYLVLGAVPVQFYGRERFSRDVDIVLFLNEKSADVLFELVKSGRYKVRYPLPHEHKLEKPDDFLDWHLLKLEDLRHKALLDVHLKHGNLGLDKKSLNNAKTVMLNGEEIVIPSAEDYLMTKLISRRPSSHDFEDIMSTLLGQYSKIDWKYLEKKAEKYKVLFLLKYYKDAIEKKMRRE